MSVSPSLESLGRAKKRVYFSYDVNELKTLLENKWEGVYSFITSIEGKSAIEPILINCSHHGEFTSSLRKVYNGPKYLCKQCQIEHAAIGHRRLIEINTPANTKPKSAKPRNYSSLKNLTQY